MWGFFKAIHQSCFVFFFPGGEGGFGVRGPKLVGRKECAFGKWRPNSWDGMGGGGEGGGGLPETLNPKP